MTTAPLRHRIRDALPPALRNAIAGVRHFGQRVARWPFILRDVRGATSEDRRTLFRSATLAPWHATRRLTEWQDPVLVRDATVAVRGVGDFSLRAYSDDLWHVIPWREKAVLAKFREVLRSGDVVVDAGANIGVYTVLASKLVGEHGRVLAVEMMPDTAARLEAHVARNELRNVEIVRRALSDVSGQVLSARVESGKFGQARIAPGHGGAPDAAEVEVSTITLDEVTRETGPIKLLKMDLEGAEHAALRGARRTLEKTQHVVFERWGTLDGRAHDPVSSLLADAGFVLARIDGNNWIASRS